MRQLVVLNLGKGDLQNGFPLVVAQLQSEGNPQSRQFTGSLPAAIELRECYSRWQMLYELLYQARSINIRRSPIDEDISIDEADITCVSEADFEDVSGELENRINTWLDSEDFRRIERQLRSQLHPRDEIRLIIQTEDSQLRQLPWYIWQFFQDYPRAEASLSSLNFEPRTTTRSATEKVRILAILGDATGIDISADKQLLADLPEAETVFLVEPQRREVSEQLWERQGWDILFFAGHSLTQAEGETGQLYINPTESLTIAQLRNALTEAIEQGLQLAIFNSCDGLGLARQLATLHIPQTIVMREPVPDLVAQEFLKYFLSEFASDRSFDLAVRKARERLQGIEGEFPGASWLPVILQNPAQVPPTWLQLCNRSSPRSDVTLSEKVVTMAFTDLVNSTAVKKYLQGSDLNARNRLYFDTILQPHRQRVEAHLADYGGRVVKTEGDAYFLVFPSAPQAVQWAVALQISHRTKPIPTPLGQLQVRIGMHTGSPLPNGEDFIGQEVDYAARVSALASGGQILLSEVTAVLVRNAGIVGLTIHPHGDRNLKGIGEVPIFELLYPQGQSLQTEPGSLPKRVPSSILLGKIAPLRSIWQHRYLLLRTSLLVTASVMGLRLLGMLQTSELQALDHLMRRRPYEQPDERLLIVQGTPEDLREQEVKPKHNASLSEPTLTELLEKLRQYEPIAIGLDIYRDFPVESAYPKLANYLAQEHLFGICKLRDPSSGDTEGVAPPPEISSERLSFSDAVADADGIIRRHLLSMKSTDPTDPCTAKNNLSFLLALYYLDKKGIQWNYTAQKELQLDAPDSGKKVVLRELQPFTGGYQRLDARGRQILLNYRSLPSPKQIARTVSVGDIVNERIPPETISQLKDRLVLVGVAGPINTSADYWPTPYSNSQPSHEKKIPGLFIQAHMVSQILSAVLDNRPLLWVWPLWGEALWIWGWSVVGGGLAYLLPKPRSLVLATGLGLVSLYGVCYLFIQQGGWLPLVPSAIALVLTAAGITWVKGGRS